MKKGRLAILFISENKRNKRDGRNLAIYVGVTIFCLVFYLIYNQFSHGVHSPFMTFLFAWPLVLGVLPSLMRVLFHFGHKGGFCSVNLYHSGVAALTVSSLLRGILDIAGSSSDYQGYLMLAGTIMLATGIVLYFLDF